MGILQALFGSQMGQTGMQSGFTPQMPQNQMQQAPQTMGLVQDILSQRFQPQGQDIAQSIFMNGTGLGTNGGITTPQAQTVNRLAPVMDIAKTLGTLNQSSLEIAKLNELMRHDKATEGNSPFAQPLTIGPMANNGQTQPFQDGSNQNIPTIMQGNAAPQQNNTAPMSILQRMQTNANNGVAPADWNGSPPAANSVSLDTIANMVSSPQTQGNTPQSGFMPIFKGNEILPGAPAGQVWVNGPNGGLQARIAPGAIEKGANGEILSQDSQGNVTQQIPPNPTAKIKLEQGLGKLADLYDKLHEVGGTVEQGGDILGKNGNLANSFAGSSFVGPEWMGSPSFGGQNIARIGGTKAQEIRDEIANITKQQVLPLMQAIGATPGMERAFQAQTALLESLGSKTTLMRQSVLGGLAQISSQAGNGTLAAKLNADQQPQTTQPQGTQQQGRVNIITPDGKTGTIDAAHVQDLLAAGGKIAQ